MEMIETIRGLINADPDVSRTKLSLQVCEWLGWRSENGKYKGMSCRMALLKLQRKGVLELPVGGKRPPKGKSQIVLNQTHSGRGALESGNNPEVKQLAEKICDLDDLGKVELIAIGNRRSVESRLWNDLMNKDHYLGSGPLCGAQIRYLIVSEKYGQVGGLSFSAAAWRLQARDQWIGWDDDARKKRFQPLDRFQR